MGRLLCVLKTHISCPRRNLPGRALQFTHCLGRYLVNSTPSVGFPGGTRGEAPACQCRGAAETGVRSLGWEDPLEKEMPPPQYSCLENPTDREQAALISCYFYVLSLLTWDEKRDLVSDDLAKTLGHPCGHLWHSDVRLRVQKCSPQGTSFKKTCCYRRNFF